MSSMHNFAPKPLSLLISQVNPWPFSHTGMTTGAEISWVEQNGGGEEKNLWTSQVHAGGRTIRVLESRSRSPHPCSTASSELQDREGMDVDQDPAWENKLSPGVERKQGTWAFSGQNFPPQA